MTLVFLNTGVTSFPDPGNWNPVNKIECVGSGTRGAGTYWAPLREGEVEPQAIGTSGGGGGGGGYGYLDNSTPAFPVSVCVAAKNQLGTGGNINALSTWWVNTSTCAAGCGDYGSQGGTGGIGGKFTPAGFKGGDTMAGGAINGTGGGGAAGPLGVGNLGMQPSIPSNSSSVGYGGPGNNGYVQGGATIGAAGASGTSWDATHGVGGGGAGGSGINSTKGGNGGSYGGGGGGAGYDTTKGQNGDGQDGLLVITYTPYTPPPPADSRAMIMV